VVAESLRKQTGISDADVGPAVHIIILAMRTRAPLVQKRASRHYSQFVGKPYLGITTE